MHCKAFGHIENFGMHSLKQVYIYVMSVALYDLDRVQRFVVMWISENPDFHWFVLPRKPISKSKYILGLNLKEKM